MKLTDLTAQFEQESKETVQQAKQIEREALSTLESDLKQQCSSAVTTLKSDLDTAKSEVSTKIATFSTTLTGQLSIVEQEARKWAPKLLNIVKWAVAAPIIATFLLCAAMIAGTLTWWKIESRERVHMRPFVTDKGETLMIVDEPTWQYCNEQTLTDKSGKKTIYQQRCRKASE
jgi:hypothetical protein